MAGMHFYFLKSILYPKRHAARVSGNLGGLWKFSLGKEREGRAGEKPTWDRSEF